MHMSGSELAVADRSNVGETLPFHEAVRARHSVRAFRPEPVSSAVIDAVLAEAQLAPSNCNTQPWNVHIVSGATRDRLSEALVAAASAGKFTPDFSFDMEAFLGCYHDRQVDQAASYMEAIGVARDDAEARAGTLIANFRFFNAPHVALLFMPSIGDNVRVGGDMGMYGQTFLLSLAARGLGGIPQTSVGFMAETIREVLGVSDELKLLYAISFGYPDEDAAANRWRIGRAPIAECVTFHD